MKSQLVANSVRDTNQRRENPDHTDIRRTLILEGQRGSAHNAEWYSSKSAENKRAFSSAFSEKSDIGSYRSTVLRMLSQGYTSYLQNPGNKKAPICLHVETDWCKTYDKND